jgi:hypothetical protein
MAETAAAKATAQGTAGKDDTGSGFGGKVIDVSAAIAGVVLAVIVLDIVTKGRISGWLLRRKKVPGSSTTPCGCTGEAAAPVEVSTVDGGD